MDDYILVMTSSEATRIVRVPILPLKMVNAFVLSGPKGCVLLDAGLPGSAPKFAAVLKRMGKSFHDVKAIVITHAHVDHAGGAHELAQLCHAPILAHAAELNFLRGVEPMTFCPTGWFGSVFVKTPAPHTPYPAVTPDVVLRGGDSLELQSYGVNAKVLHTPGHTPGSLSVLLPNGEALVGDMVASGVLLGGIVALKSPKSPPFELAPLQVADTLEELILKGATRFHLGHGGPLATPEVLKHVAALKRSGVKL